VKIGSRWPEDGMRKWEVIVSRVLRSPLWKRGLGGFSILDLALFPTEAVVFEQRTILIVHEVIG